MDASRQFSKELYDFCEGNLECKSIIIPNSFSIKRISSSTAVAKYDNKEIIVTEKICNNYTMIGNIIWSNLANRRKYLDYAIVGYIANAINFNTNVIRLDINIIKSLVCKEINARTYMDSIVTLKELNIIKSTNVRGVFAVNPIMIFKGSIFKLLDIIDTYDITANSVTEDKVNIDKFAIAKDVKATNIKVIYNKKYYKEGLGFNFTKKINNKKVINNIGNDKEVI